MTIDEAAQPEGKEVPHTRVPGRLDGGSVAEEENRSPALGSDVRSGAGDAADIISPPFESAAARGAGSDLLRCPRR